MKIQTENRSLHMSGEFVSSGFTILASAKAFHLLMDGLYSQKIAAVVRELGTNAYDSHVSVGKTDVPFKCHLPNDLEPFLTVSDTGSGMSHDFISTKYNCFFLSDKTETNDQTGCMGLGSKAPFCYTDSYTLTSVHNGVKTVYNPLLDDKGNPVIMKLSSESTDEPNGVEIKLSVKKADFHIFAEEAKKIYSWFKVRPIVTGRAGFAFENREFLYETDQYGLNKKNTYNDSRVVMGNVAYPIVRHSIPGINHVCMNLLDHGVTLFVDIGDVQITPSRESLSFDAITAAFLKKRLEAVVADVGNRAKHDIECAPTLWEARKALYDSKQTGFIGQAISLATIRWNGQGIDSFYNRVPEDPIVYVLRKRRASYHRKMDNRIDANDWTVYVDDMGRGGRATITRDMADKNLSYSYVIEVGETPPAELNRMLDASGLRPIVVYASTLPKLPKVKRVRSATTPRIELYDMISPTRRYGSNNYWTKSNDDANTGGIYAVINRYSVLKGEESQHPRTLTHQLQLLGQLGFDQKVHGVSKANINKLKKAGNWIEVWDYLDNCMEKLKKKGMVEKTIESTRLEHVGYYNDLIVLDKAVKLRDDSPLKELAEKIKSAVKTKDDPACYAFKKLCVYMDVEIKSDESLGKEKEKVMEKYPMLGMVGFNHSKAQWKAIEDYINMMEKEG